MHIANLIVIRKDVVEQNHLFTAKNKTVLNSKIADFLRNSKLFDAHEIEEGIKCCLSYDYVVADDHRQIFISSPVIEKE